MQRLFITLNLIKTVILEYKTIETLFSGENKLKKINTRSVHFVKTLFQIRRKYRQEKAKNK